MVLREKFDVSSSTTDSSNKHSARRCLAVKPKKIKTDAVKKLLNRTLWAQGIRKQPLKNGTRRHEFKTTHGYRKYFKSNAERVMRLLNVELLMDHKTEVSDSYWRPTEQDLLEDYLRAVDYLTINRDVKIAHEIKDEIMDKLWKKNDSLNLCGLNWSKYVKNRTK